MHARYYSPTGGRFLSVDPEDPGGSFKRPGGLFQEFDGFSNDNNGLDLRNFLFGLQILVRRSPEIEHHSHANGVAQRANVLPRRAQISKKLRGVAEARPYDGAKRLVK
jgi:hypothetical protein